MRDPDEGLDDADLIVTGARRDRVPATFEPVMQAAVRRSRELGNMCSLYVYGSVATGTAQLRASDVDLLAVDMPADVASAMARDLTSEFHDLCRAVEVASVRTPDYYGDHDQAYGNRVFLRHYCVHLSGPRPDAQLPGYTGDVHAARGFNGDLGQHVQRWRAALADGGDPAPLGRMMARKALLAVAGLVSVHDHTWTTDRLGAARRWAEVEPAVEAGLRTLARWADDHDHPTTEAVQEALDGVVATLLESFERSIGLWS